MQRGRIETLGVGRAPNQKPPTALAAANHVAAVGALGGPELVAVNIATEQQGIAHQS